MHSHLHMIYPSPQPRQSPTSSPFALRFPLPSPRRSFPPSSLRRSLDRINLCSSSLQLSQHFRLGLWSQVLERLPIQNQRRRRRRRGRLGRIIRHHNQLLQQSPRHPILLALGEPLIPLLPRRTIRQIRQQQIHTIVQRADLRERRLDLLHLPVGHPARLDPVRRLALAAYNCRPDLVLQKLVQHGHLRRLLRRRPRA